MKTLIEYQQRTRLLMNDATFARFNDFDFQSFINSARLQVAGEGECLRVRGLLTLTAGTQEYPFSAAVMPTGVAGPINVRTVMLEMAGSDPLIRTRVTPREWEWFERFVLGQLTPTPSAPAVWAQFGQGVNGTIWVNLPDLPYVLDLDAVCYPIQLVDNSTDEALPIYWSDAVPYYAAYLAYFTAQDTERAGVMHQQYDARMKQARQYATPGVLPHQYAQGPDLVAPNRLGLQTAKAG